MKAVYAPLEPENDESRAAGQQASYRAGHVARQTTEDEPTFILRIQESRQALPYDFSLAFTLGYGGINLIFFGASTLKQPVQFKTTDPGSEIFYFGQKMNSVPPELDGTGLAPDTLFMASLGRSSWYWSPGARRFVPPPAGLWTRISCDG